MKKAYLATAAVAAVLGSVAANAALTVNISGGGGAQYNATDALSPGYINFANLGLTNGGALLSGTITGVGFVGGLASPGLGVNTTSLSAINLTTPTTYTITVVQSGLTYAGTLFDVTNTINGLGGNVASVGTTASIGATQISSLSCAPCTTSYSNEQIANAAHSGTYSETTVYTVTFGANSSGRSDVQISTQIAAAAVPEAATWAMMVLGFGAIGGALRTSRRKVAFA